MEKCKIFSIEIRIRIYGTPMSFQEEKGKFKILSIRVHDARIIFYEERKSLNFLNSNSN